jgi:NAD(P)-dependent dehydrogenase (short-subunit alcohol dehydrogenase family)
LDVTSDCDVINAYDFVVRECSLLDLKLWAIVNNAGVLTCGPIEWGLMRDIDQVFQINVFGYVRIIRQFLPLIRKSRGNE